MLGRGAAFSAVLCAALPALGPARAGGGSVQHCTELLYFGSASLARADVCGTSKASAAAFKKRYDRECAGLFDGRQEGLVLDQALKDARSDYAERGMAKFCSG